MRENWAHSGGQAPVSPPPLPPSAGPLPRRPPGRAADPLWVGQTGPSGGNNLFNHISNRSPNTTRANTRLGVSRATAQQHAIARYPLEAFRALCTNRVITVCCHNLCQCMSGRPPSTARAQMTGLDAPGSSLAVYLTRPSDSRVPRQIASVLLTE
jgi:DNA-binding transcriptional regulator YdaS (Cro superfamily)